MSTSIYMGDKFDDVDVDQAPNEFIHLVQSDHTIILTPEGARSLAFVIMGMTDTPLKPGQLTGKICSECGEPQFNSPSGITCPNGHGGAEAAP